MSHRRTLAEVPEVLSLDRLKTPIGECLLLTDQLGKLRALDWAEYESRMRQLLGRQDRRAEIGKRTRAPETIRRAIAGYFEGDLTAIDDIECQTGGTEFQRSVWRTLR